ncbi:hypothetical protein, conserved [Trypanosoma vivax Y486]|uniref:Uncharacterized protein n=1 Tax=Trypanosoma vivax (strain Y486) TaxID=1055687 RepID=F9WUK0_TRYVY|nr:hypothetical protein, conserved [Trypanosoma vivax Y486]|eukprot:CCD21249.1 hypothetical protein, conserved [Trypanosoma vivax Y486]
MQRKVQRKKKGHRVHSAKREKQKEKK